MFRVTEGKTVDGVFYVNKAGNHPEGKAINPAKGPFSEAATDVTRCPL